ncbi:hypothetical protein BVX97_06120, partial [bacterium E08(2017)]
TLGLGIGDPGDAMPDSAVTFEGLSANGGALGFNGYTGSDKLGNFVLDLEHIDPVLDTSKRYFLSMRDYSYSSETGIVEAFWLEDSAGNVLATATNTPFVVNHVTRYSWADFSLTDAQSSTVSIVAAVADAYEGTNAPGIFVVSRTGSTNEDLYVNISTSGTAVAGVDYLPFSQVCLIPAGATSSTIEILAVEDDSADEGETIIATLQPGLAYALSGSDTATITLHEKDNGLPPLPPALDYKVIVPQYFRVPENGSAQIPVRLNRSPLGVVPDGVVTVNFFEDYGNDADLVLAPQTRVFTADNWDVPQYVTATAANDADAGHGYELMGITGSGYYSRGMGLYEHDDDATTVVAEFDKSIMTITEGGTGTFNVRLMRDPGGPYNVNLGGASDPISYVSSTTLSFDSSNWMNWQEVTVQAGSDTNTTDDYASLYAGWTPKAYIAVVQDDSDADQITFINVYAEADAAEPSSNGAFKVCRVGVTNTPLDVYLFVAGAATEGSDFET